MATLIDGTAIAKQIRQELTKSILDIKELYNVTPGLAVILVGARRDSATYVRMKKRACTETGMNSFGFDYPAEVQESELLSKIDELNNGAVLCGFLSSFSYCPIEQIPMSAEFLFNCHCLHTSTKRLFWRESEQTRMWTAYTL